MIFLFVKISQHIVIDITYVTSTTTYNKVFLEIPHKPKLILELFMHNVR